MIPYSRMFKILLVSGLCLFSLFDLRSMQGLVVCLGSDGHIELESSRDGNRCQSLGESPATEQIIDEAEIGHCGECRDVGLLAPVSLFSIRGHALTLPASIAWVIQVLRASDLPRLTLPCDRFFRSAPPLGEIALLPIRSIVIRI
jgi:hypothetical protein